MARAMILVFLAATIAFGQQAPKEVQAYDKDAMCLKKPGPFNGSGGEAEKVPEDVLREINNAMSGKEKIMFSLNNDLVRLGFDSGTTLSTLQVGTPVHLYKIDINALNKLGANSAVKDVITPMDEWGVPLFKKGSKARTAFLIAKLPNHSHWAAGGYGFGGWAVAWAELESEWPVSSGYHLYAIGQLDGPHYFYIPEKGENNLTSLYWKDGRNRRNIAAGAYSSLDSSRITLTEYLHVVEQFQAWKQSQK